MAKAQFEAAKLQVTGAVLDFAATVQSAFYRHQADEQRLELLQTVAEALATSLAIARRLHAAGNIPDLDLAREQAGAEEAKVQLRAAETTAQASREQLNIFMGLWGQETAWHVERRLPVDASRAASLEGLEARALRASLDLASARQQMIVAGEAFGVNRATALLPEAALGAGGERDDGEWKVGPLLEFPIPLFDQGQARTGRAGAELRRAQQAYYALGVRIRATVRTVLEQMQGAEDRARYTRTFSCRCLSASSVRPSCNITPCNWASLSSCGQESSRFGPP